LEINFEEIAISLATSTVTLGVIVYIFKNVIINKITASIKHKYDTRLAELESTLKNNNNEVDTLRNNILSGVNTRNKLLHEARINAVNVLWSNVQELKKNPLVLQTMLSIPDNTKDKNIFIHDVFSKISLDDETIRIDKSNLVKPYISKYGWALFEAFCAIHILPYLQIKYILIDTNGEVDFLSNLVATVSEALPNRQEYLQKNGLRGIPFVISELENILLDELQSILDGTNDDHKHILAIEKINKLTNETNIQKLNADKKS